MNPEESEPLKPDLQEENPPEVSKTDDVEPVADESAKEKLEDYGDVV